jgi:NhaP-type Na+/H+ or K+/H+ antiporter
VATVVTFLVGSAVPWVSTGRLGVAPAIGLLVAYLMAALLWALTPATVRQVIRRTDDLTGRRRAPNWRRPLLGALVAAVALAIPLDVPKPDGCDGKYQSACAEPIVAPVIQNPTRSIPPTPQQPSRSPKATAASADPTAVADLRMLTHGQ